MRFFISIAFSMAINWAFAQTNCLHLDSKPSNFESSAEDFNQYVLQFRADGKHLNTAVKTIPVVIHIIYDSAADSLSLEQAESQIAATNLDLRRLNADTVKTRQQFKIAAADTHVELCLAAKNPVGQSTSGVVWHKIPGFTADSLYAVMQQTQWPPLRYLNVWVNPGVPGGSSTFAWQAGEPADGFQVGGKVFGTLGNLNPGQEGGGVFTHELGHYLGLYHTFEDGFNYLGNCDFPNSDSTGDRANDTPLDWDWPFSAELCTDGQRMCDDGTTFFVQNENFMAYSNDTCANMFSKAQRIRMRAALDSLRAELCSPTNLALTGCGDPIAVQNPSFEKTGFAVFPNPADAWLTVGFPGSEKASVLVFNQLGKLVREFANVRNGQILPVNDWPPGVYFFKIDTMGRPSRLLSLLKV